MNTFFVFLALAAICIASTDGYIYCYFCANCPIPFNPNAPGVSRVTSNTNFCAKKSYSSAPSTPNSLGAADPGLCVVTGCRWVVDPFGGPQIYTCCCNSDYCNGSM